LALLLASSVHDIKNSLGMLIGTLEEVVRSTPIRDQTQRHQFATLQGEAARINNALMSLLGLYRLQQEQLPVRVQEVFVADFLDEQIAANQLLFGMRGLNVRLHCDPQLCAYFDPNLIGGIINNVLVNAAHYARGGIVVSGAREPDELVINVQDDGPGFPDKMLDDVCNHQRGIDFASGSTSLGLYFAREIAQLHRRGHQCGRIALSNLEGGGGCFSLWLP